MEKRKEEEKNSRLRRMKEEFSGENLTSVYLKQKEEEEMHERERKELQERFRKAETEMSEEKKKYIYTKEKSKDLSLIHI